MSTSVIAMKHDLQDKKSASKQKRFKVGKACFTCRVKKIKCDGLQPCMQCKARSRPCTFSKDGSVLEAGANEQDNESIDASPSPSTSRASTPPTSTLHHSPKFKKPLPVDQKLLSSTTEILNRLNKLWPAEGKEGKWDLDQTKLTTRTSKAPLHDHTLGIDYLPSKSIQHAHIQSYFKHCYSVFPIIPKRIFFKQFDSPIQHYNASYLLTPVLLLMVMAHGAQQTQDDESDTWFQHAKSLISQQQPKLSTVIALTLMSQFQSTYNPQPAMFGAMAFQMCLDLNLMRNYTGENDMLLYQDEMDGGSDLKELQKRVCWGCYTLDKLIHIQAGQPWMLRSRDISLDMPLLQPGDDVTEHQILETFVCTIKLLQIAERTLQSDQQQAAMHQPIVRTHTYDQMSLNSDNALLDWLRSLPLHLQWTPLLNHSNNNALSTPAQPANLMVCHLHILYNIIELCVLKPYVSSTVKSIQTRSAAVATHLVRLISALIDHDTVWYYNYDFTTYALIESIKFHLGQCSCENLVLARHARFMFQQSMPLMKKLLTLVKTPSTLDKMTRFISNLENAITEADNRAAAAAAANNADMFGQDDIMTPFVLGSLNAARYGDEERHQWSKLDYFANGLITPPTVKSKPSISMSSTMFVPPTMSSFHSYGASSHSAITDNLFQTAAAAAAAIQQPQPQQQQQQQHHEQHDWRATPDRFQYTKINNSTSNNNNQHPLEFLHNQQQPPPPQWLPATSTKKSSTTTADTNNSDLTDIDALVAQIQENNNSPNSHSSSNDSASSSTTAAVAATVAMVTNENENLLYSLLSDRGNATSSTTNNSNNTSTTASNTTTNAPPTRNQSYSSIVQPYMNVGLGIYASAHQHHNDVIRQHLPATTTSTKVVLTQHPQNQ